VKILTLLAFFLVLIFIHFLEKLVAHVLDDMDILLLVLKLRSGPHLLQVKWVTLDLFNWTGLVVALLAGNLDSCFLVIFWLYVVIIVERGQEIFQNLVIMAWNGITDLGVHSHLDIVTIREINF
jgi:hypothetical protein